MSNYGPTNEDATGGKTPALTIWQRITLSPSVQTFARYLPESDLGRAVLWLVIATLISSIAAGLPALIRPQAQMRDMMRFFRESLPPDVARELPPMMPGMGARTISLGTLLCGIPSAVIFGLIGAFIGVGLIHLAARLLQGQGTYTDTFFLTAAVSAPFAIATGTLQLIGGLLGLVPILGVIISVIFGLVSLALSIYALVLNAMAVAAAHRFSLGKGFAAVLLPGVVIFLLICCCTVIGLTLMGASLAPFLEELQREFSMYMNLIAA